MPELANSSVTESPVDTKSSPTYRLGLAAVIGLAVVIVAVLAVMIVGVTQGWGHKSQAAAPVKKPISMTLAPGYRILSSDTQPGRLILHVRSVTDDEIWVLNTDDGSVVARIHGEAPK